MTPTARTLAYLRRLGFLAAKVEVFIPAVRRHRDLFGIADCIGVHPGDRRVLLVQCTSAAHVSDRLRRIKGRPELPGLLRAGLLVEVWGWKRIGKRWHVRRVAVCGTDLDAVPLTVLPRRKRRGKHERQGELFPQ